VDYYNIDMDDFDPSDIHAYPTFEDFFIRKQTASSRLIYKENNSNVSVCDVDSRLVTYETVPIAKKLWIEGSDFSIENLIMDTQLSGGFANGAIASFRLSGYSARSACFVAAATLAVRVVSFEFEWCDWSWTASRGHESRTYRLATVPSP
jgi:phosphatidylserine decarboxylase